MKQEELRLSAASSFQSAYASEYNVIPVLCAQTDLRFAVVFRKIDLFKFVSFIRHVDSIQCIRCRRVDEQPDSQEPRKCKTV